MTIISLCSLLVASGALVNAFSFTSLSGTGYSIRRHDMSVRLASSSEEQRKQEIFAQETMNAANMKSSAEMMKNMKPEDIDRMIKDMDNMPASQMEQMNSMGMNVDMMKSTMQMMKNNPAMVESMGKMMGSMTPEQLMEQSRVAQQNMVQQQEAAPAVPSAVATTNEVVDAVLEGDDEDEDEEYDTEPIVCDPEILEVMYRVAEIMSEPQTSSGGVTFEAFSTLPIITVLIGVGDEDSLTRKELKECWAKGSLGASRLDRSAFGRVWAEVQDEYYNDIVEEAREQCHKKGKKKRGPLTSVDSAPQSTTTPVVGQNLDPEILANNLKNLSENDLSSMFDSMKDMTPAQEESMRAMGVDPNMMKKSAEMFKNNPLMSKAAAAMMKNTSPEQLMKASQQAQEKLKNMSEKDKKKMMDSM